MTRIVTNAQRFLAAYNRIDKILHSRFGFKPSMSYTDAVRRAASINSVVRKFEDDLIDYGRLRNAIVHKSDATRIIAEPHQEVTDRLCHIADILVTPPLASSIAHSPRTVKPNESLKEVIRAMVSGDISNLPIVQDKTVVGCLTNKSIVAYVAQNLDNLDSALKTATVADVGANGSKYYRTLHDCPVDDVLAAFEKNRRLQIVIITADGTVNTEVTGVVTVGDLVTINRMLDSY